MFSFGPQVGVHTLLPDRFMDISIIRKSTYILLFIKVFHVLSHGVLSATVLSNGKLESCVVDGSSASVVTHCSEKLTASVVVENGETIATSSLDVEIPCVGSQDGKCPCACEFGKNGCTCQNLTTPVKIQVYKEPIKITYPLIYDKVH